MSIKQKKKQKLILCVVLPIAIFFLIFVPIVIGGGELEIMLNTVGFRESEDDPFAMTSSITIHNSEKLTVVVHRQWEATSITITTSTVAQSIKAVLKKKGAVDIVLGETENVDVATFYNSYAGDTGDVMNAKMSISNHLNIDTNQYYDMLDIDTWLEITVDVSGATDVSISMLEA